MDARKVAGRQGQEKSKEKAADAKKKSSGKAEPRWGNHQKAWKILVLWIKENKVSRESQGDDVDMAIYEWHEEFMKFQKEKWLGRLKACREVVRKKLVRVERDRILYDRFRKRNPIEKRRKQRSDGYGVWHGSEADKVFKEDIKQGVELKYKSWQEYMDSKKEVYKDFKVDQLRWRKGYLKRRKKFDHWVDKQKKKKLSKIGMLPPVEEDDGEEQVIH